MGGGELAEVGYGTGLGLWWWLYYYFSLLFLDLAAISEKQISVSATDRQCPKNMQGAANISLLFITHLYISATNHLAPMYQCCTVRTYKKFHGINYDTLLVLQTWMPVTYSKYSGHFWLPYVLAPKLLVQQERLHQNTGALMHRNTNILAL